jgi:DNA repair exonuclease SbcCD ATPase subunit
MAIPAVIQGTVEVKGKVFELDSPKGAAWLEAIGSFRFEPSGDGKPCTIRREPSGYWYGCRKIAGKVRKKYIGKTSEISTARLEEISEALEVPPAARASKVAEVAQEVAQNVGVAEVAEVAEVVQDRLTALELEVASLRKALEALQEALPGKLNSGNSAELPKVDSEVAEELQNKLGNPPPEPEHIEFLKRLVAKKDPLISSDLWQEIERLKERNRLLLIKSREERQKLEEKISALEYRDKSQSRRLEEKQSRLDELEEQLEQVRSDYAKLLESSTHVTNKLRDEAQVLRSQLETERADREEVEADLQAEREELAQLKKEAKEAAAEIHREGRSIELEKTRWQQQLSDARAELADAKATILNQGNKIRELERGYSLQPNPAEKRLRLEIGELQAQLSDLKQNSEIDFDFAGKAGELVSWLRKTVGKSLPKQVTVKEVQKILEGRDN